MHNLPKCIITNLNIFIFLKLSDLFLSITFILRLAIFMHVTQVAILCA